MFCAEADFFFADPLQSPQVPGSVSILHLLRRDAISCLGLDPGTGEPSGHQTLWPGAITTLAGIDLLAKFHSGSDSTRGVGKRFKAFLSEYFRLTADESDALYHLRCALLHSFGLYSQSKTRKYRFALMAQQSALITRVDDEQYLVDLLTLYNRFEDAIAAYVAALEKDVDLQSKFRRIFVDYGAVGSGPLQPGA